MAKMSLEWPKSPNSKLGLNLGTPTRPLILMASIENFAPKVPRNAEVGRKFESDVCHYLGVFIIWSTDGDVHLPSQMCVLLGSYFWAFWGSQEGRRCKKGPITFVKKAQATVFRTPFTSAQALLQMNESKCMNMMAMLWQLHLVQ